MQDGYKLICNKRKIIKVKPIIRNHHFIIKLQIKKYKKRSKIINLINYKAKLTKVSFNSLSINNLNWNNKLIKLIIISKKLKSIRKMIMKINNRKGKD